jgi:hypothetical protein
MAGFDKWLYNFAKRRAAPSLKLTGESDTVGNTAVTVLLRDSEGHVILCSGTSVPTGADYAKGCLFIKTDVTTGSSGLYDNQGTKAAASFQVITGSAGITTDLSTITSTVDSGIATGPSTLDSAVASVAKSNVTSGDITDSAITSKTTSAVTLISQATSKLTSGDLKHSVVESEITSGVAVDSVATSQLTSADLRASMITSKLTSHSL